MTGIKIGNSVINLSSNMVRIKSITLIAFLLFLSCNSINRRTFFVSYQEQLKQQEENFNEYFTVESLFDVFPDHFENEGNTWFTSTPSIDLKEGHCAMFGIFILKSKTHKQSGLSDESNNIQRVSRMPYSSDSCCKIYLNRLTRYVDSSASYNVYEDGYLIVPCFERDYVFSDSTLMKSKIWVGKEKYYESLYYVPSDLQVNVVDARAGDFWKNDCNEYRPESLKEWKHGYSKGFATSDKENIIVYWTMIW